ncbi:MAG TPA: FAD-binding oxidoreductase [Longimicrobiales bacterium]
MIETLRQIAGADAARAGEARDAVHDARPRAVVAPRDASVCAAVLERCSSNDWTVEIAGARSARASGRAAPAADVVLSTERMRAVTEYEPDDLTIGIAAGLTVGELRAHVAAHRQRVPLDPVDARASVGGVLARAAAGAMRRSWATPRRQVLGLEVVTGDGRVLRAGGRVVKNVAGYDLNKLMVGSMGTLGVITAAHLRLLPVPQAHATRAARSDAAAPLVELARALLAQHAQPAALELTGPPWRLVVLYEGGRDAVAAAVAGADALGTAATEDPELDAIARAEADAAVIVRVGVLPDRIGGAIEWLERVSAAGTIAAHAGDGIARLILDDEEARALTSADFTEMVESARAQLPGSVVVERAPATLMRAVDPWGSIDPGLLRLMTGLKRQFDPAGILQRGRWIV